MGAGRFRTVFRSYFPRWRFTPETSPDGCICRGHILWIDLCGLLLKPRTAFGSPSHRRHCFLFVLGILGKCGLRSFCIRGSVDTKLGLDWCAHRAVRLWASWSVCSRERAVSQVGHWRGRIPREGNFDYPRRPTTKKVTHFLTPNNDHFRDSGIFRAFPQNDPALTISGRILCAGRRWSADRDRRNRSGEFRAGRPRWKGRRKCGRASG